MKLALGLDLYRGAQLRVPVEQVRLAEDLGYHSVWTAEAYGSDALSPLAYLAALTTRIKLGTGVTQIAARTPAATAMHALTIDALAGGNRTIIGLGVSGPQIVERGLGQKITKEALGGPAVAVERAGTIDNVAATEEEAFAMIRRFLSFLPSNVWQLPPVLPAGDPVDRCEDELIRIVPRDPRKPYSMKRVLELVLDRDSMFEIQPHYGKSAITALARIGGFPVGVIANNPMVGGRIDVKSARKHVRFMELCDTFHIPILFFLDVPGFLIGREAEEAAMLREGTRAMFAKCQVSVPIVSVVTRKCYGMGGAVGLDTYGLDFKIAWPSGEWGSLAVEGGVRAEYRREIESAPDPARREKEIEADLKRLTSPFLAAESFAVEDLIDPRETRPYLHRFVKAMQVRLATETGPKARYGVRP